MNSTNTATHSQGFSSFCSFFSKTSCIIFTLLLCVLLMNDFAVHLDDSMSLSTRLLYFYWHKWIYGHVSRVLHFVPVVTATEVVLCF